MPRNQKRHLQRLLLIQPRITITRVIRLQILLHQPLTAAHTLRDRIPGQLQMHAPEITPLLLVHLQRPLQLREDIPKPPGLDPRRRRSRVPMHRIALPDHAAPVLARLHGADVRRQQLGDPGRAVARDQRDLAHFARGVEDAQERHEVGDGGCGADLDADGVRDAAEVLDVRAVDLAGAVADPEEVGGGVVVGFPARGGCVVSLWYWDRGRGLRGDWKLPS